MIYSRPQPFAEARDASRVRALLPATLRSAGFEKLVADGYAAVLERARFSAGVVKAEHLDVLDTGINALVDGSSDLATQRLAAKQFLRGTGYMAPIDEQGSITDLAGDARINLQLEMGVQQAQGYGWWKQGQDEDLLWAFPAREFVRVESREVPRVDWPQRWDAARAATTTEGTTASSSGRMIALVGHPIWAKLNRFGVEYEPFDFGSGMGVNDVSRKVAIGLGLLAPETRIPPRDRPFNSDLQASPEIRSATLRSLLEQTGVGTFDSAGVFHVGDGGDS